MNKIDLKWNEVYTAAAKVARDMKALSKLREEGDPHYKLYGVPRGGIPAAMAVITHLPHCKLVDNPNQADIFIDDILDSGKTFKKYGEKYNKPFFALIDKKSDFTKRDRDKWISFPWERMVNEEQGVEDVVTRTLQFIGEDPEREGLLDTPKRVIKSWKELYGGYHINPADLMTTFTKGACDEMVVLKDIEFISTCEHHMLPFHGKAAVAYVPNGKVIGVSKLARILDAYARRLQIQEQLCQQVTTALDEHLKPVGSACVIEASHMCMVCRGVRKQHSKMVTSSLTGIFKEDQAARAELMQLVHG